MIPKPHGFFVVTALIYVLAITHRSTIADESAKPLLQAHAHNDYLHDRPLLDALDHGFNSVEADIFLVDGQLLVAHSILELKPERTLAALYLEPLRKRIQNQGGRVFSGGAPFLLLIDIKSEAESTYKVLDQTLAEFRDIVSSIRDGQPEMKAVNVVISGNRPTATLTKQSVRYAGLDGRFADLNSKLSPELIPLISDNWTLHFKWRGEGPWSDTERQKLAEVVAKAHSHGRKLRLWATPDNPSMWKALRDSGVDMINTDDLAGLEKFLHQ